jgi:hypothetical protein
MAGPIVPTFSRAPSCMLGSFDVTLNGRWLVYLKLGTLQEMGESLRKGEPSGPMQVFASCIVQDSWSHLEDVPAIDAEKDVNSSSGPT